MNVGKHLNVHTFLGSVIDVVADLALVGLALVQYSIGGMICGAGRCALLKYS